MNAHQPPPQENNTNVELFLLLVGLVIAWPALLLGMVARWQIKQRASEPFPYWVGAGIVGALGALLLATRANPYPFLLAVLRDVVPLVLHMSVSTFTHFVGDVLPLWARSVLVFPWCAVLFELFGTRNLQASLLTQERQRRAAQIKQSQRAARKATNAPDQINGKAIFGALIDNPNE